MSNLNTCTQHQCIFGLRSHSLLSRPGCISRVWIRAYFNYNTICASVYWITFVDLEVNAWMTG